MMNESASAEPERKVPEQLPGGPADWHRLAHYVTHHWLGVCGEVWQQWGQGQHWAEPQVHQEGRGGAGVHQERGEWMVLQLQVCEDCGGLHHQVSDIGNKHTVRL